MPFAPCWQTPAPWGAAREAVEARARGASGSGRRGCCRGGAASSERPAGALRCGSQWPRSPSRGSPVRPAAALPAGAAPALKQNSFQTRLKLASWPYTSTSC